LIGPWQLLLAKVLFLLGGIAIIGLVFRMMVVSLWLERQIGRDVAF
jgi:hypothetical protein